MTVRSSLMFCSLTSLAIAQSPIEWGRIAWQRDFDAAQARAAQQQLPRLALFQEVPG